MKQKTKQLRTPFIVGIALFAPSGIGIISMVQSNSEMGLMMQASFEHAAVLLVAIMELSIIRHLLLDIKMNVHRGHLLMKVDTFDRFSLESMTDCFLSPSSNAGNMTTVARLRMEKIVDVALGAVFYSQGLVFGMGLIQRHAGNETLLSGTFAISFLAFLLLAILGLCFVVDGLKDDMLEYAFKRLI